MKKHLNLFAVLMFLVVLAALLARYRRHPPFRFQHVTGFFERRLDDRALDATLSCTVRRR